ncbi:tRNA (adenosine(37)-N6)-threonylcarbamoyltransferase complex dimerization subunit type 1 TsaB, partial [candidate division KSB1 bacterium]|nr:tRNA (adenosine(37)-N6)-threonylcarbamoyltransferase complex dimerization subunit type 1 TsaB [candidate division KSB1 bacterium]
MIILGIETATQVCGVALARDGVLLCEYRSNMKNIHARVLTASIEKIWQDAQVEAGQLNGIAVSIGPGSFTGLRIGLSTAKGIAFAVGCPIMAVPTLQALAHQAPVTAGTICPILRSRPDQV